MKKLLVFLTLLATTTAMASAKIQNEDVKSVADLGGSGNMSHLINDTKLYLTAGSLAKQLSTALTDGSLFKLISPQTTKGDLIGFSTTNIRHAVGTNGYLLTADSTQTDGIGWQQLNLGTSTAITGVASSVNGGSGVASPTAHTVLVGAGASPFVQVSPSTAGLVLTSNGPSADPTFQASSASPTSVSDLYNLSFAEAVATNNWTISLKQSDASTDPAGGGPVKIGFRSSTLASAAYNTRSITSALSITVPSGATLGTSSGVAAVVWLYALDDAGTVDLCVQGDNSGGATPYMDYTTYTSTQISSGAGTPSVLYCGSSHSGAKPIRLIGKMTETQTTAGTWAAVSTERVVAPTQAHAVQRRSSLYATAGTFTFTTPPGTTLDTVYKITACGGGGAANTYNGGSGGGGGGGGGGAVSYASNLSGSYTVVVGAGGATNVWSGSLALGAAGGASSFGSTIAAASGGSQSNNYIIGGFGGVATSTTNGYSLGGGAGMMGGTLGGFSDYGGVGGSGACGGGGGRGGYSGTTVGSGGAFPGGGGGGGYDAATSGAGGGGMVLIEWNQ